jgi:hypothetical protein
LARIPLQQALLNAPQFQPARDKIESRRDEDAIWEGRLAATRWLIEFVGVSADGNGMPKWASPHPPHDARITDLGGRAFDLTLPDSVTLAKVWLGCSQASSHATHASGHPPVNEQEITAAMKIVMAHLDQEVYSCAGQTIASVALCPNP